MANNYLEIIKVDPYLDSFEGDLHLRMNNFTYKKEELVGKRGKLTAFANGYHYFGFHKTIKGWVYRE